MLKISNQFLFFWSTFGQYFKIKLPLFNMKGVKIVVQDNYVKISYSYNYSRKRFSTGIKLDSPDQISELGKLKGSVKDKVRKQMQIDDLRNKVESRILEFHKNCGRNPTVDELENLLKDDNSLNSETDRLLVAYQQFYNEKIELFDNSDTKKIQSLNSHRALLYYLTDYETLLGRPIFFYEINKKWMFEFKKFNESKRENSTTKKYITFGGIRGNTLRKKVNIFIHFMKWAHQKKLCPAPTEILGFGKEIEMPDIRKATITKNELFQIQDIELKSSSHEFIRDLFVFACWTGLRWSDLISLKKSEIRKTDEGIALIKKAVKTRDKFTIYLNDICLSILEKYDYNLERIKNPAYNRALKSFLKSTGLFNDETDFEGANRLLERWEVISIHRARDSFITILLGENVPLSTLMQYTGHKKLSTLEGYIDKNTKVVNFMTKITKNE